MSLTAETISQEGHLSKGAELFRVKLEGCWGPAGTALLRQLLEPFSFHNPHISCNRNEYRKQGSVGMPIIGGEVKISNPNDAGEGEIL